MNAKVALCALVVAAAAAATPLPAAAQYYPVPGGYYETLPPYAIRATLRAQGLRQITPPIQTGNYVVVRAVDETGEVVRVLINARYGNIVQIIPLPPGMVGQPAYRPYGPPARGYPAPPPRYSDARPDLKVEPAPPGPNDPYDGYNALEQRSAVTPPAAAPRTPMPRPRPAIAAATPRADAAEPRATSKPSQTTAGGAAKAQAFPPAAPLE